MSPSAYVVLVCEIETDIPLWESNLKTWPQLGRCSPFKCLFWQVESTLMQIRKGHLFFWPKTFSYQGVPPYQGTTGTPACSGPGNEGMWHMQILVSYYVIFDTYKSIHACYKNAGYSNAWKMDLLTNWRIESLPVPLTFPLWSSLSQFWPLFYPEEEAAMLSFVFIIALI